MSEFRMPEMQSYNRKFWEAAADGRLEIQHCPECDSFVYPPRSACPECFADLEWIEADGTGTLYSFSVLHHPDPPSAVSEEILPVLSAVVELEEGPRVAAEFVNCDRDEAILGMNVTVTFDETPDGRMIPKFEPA